MKNKILLAVLFGVLGLVSKSSADEYYTTQSTGVLFSSKTVYTIERVILSTGSPSEYVLLIDSKPLQVTAGGNDNSSLIGTGGDLTRFPAAQWIRPPMLYRSTITASLNVGEAGEYTIGVRPRNGLIIWQSAVGGTVTLIVSRRTVPSSDRTNAFTEEEFQKLAKGSIHNLSVKMENSE